VSIVIQKPTALRFQVVKARLDELDQRGLESEKDVVHRDPVVEERQVLVPQRTPRRGWQRPEVVDQTLACRRAHFALENTGGGLFVRCCWVPCDGVVLASGIGER